MLHHLPPVMGAANRGPISNPTYQPPLEQKPMHPGRHWRETFAEPSNCSANTHCEQTLQKPLNTPKLFPENTGQP
jgi:hypothetical protein